MEDFLEKKTAFFKIYDELSPAIFRHCYFRVFDRERARELMQESFVKTWERIVAGDKIETPRAFLYRVANNLVIDESRKKKAVSLEAMQETGFDVGFDSRGKTEQVMEGKEIIKVVNALDPKYRDAVLLRYIEDLSPKEISELTGESENNVSVRLHRGIKQLKEILENYGEQA